MRGTKTTVLTAIAAVAAALLAALAQPAAPQPRAKPDRGADLRPIYATPQDITEGKRLADSACARCHGANGISATAG
ncbi:MAG TPA: hypothetical protein VFR86_21930, partial [Burkholderiaceae bacterium]|nr:hypothetical protein [Burkholderiaceae bacterium]